MNSKNFSGNGYSGSGSGMGDKLNILVMGRSGAGKSTFINVCCNLALRLKLKDKRRIAVPTKFKRYNGKIQEYPCNIPEYVGKNVGFQERIGSSDTKFVSFYNLEADGVSILLIDTPGFGDTGGPRVDEANAKKIVEEVSKITQIQAILWVSKGDENRITMELKYCIDHFRGMLPLEYKSNVFACFTHVASPTKVDAIDILKEMNIPSSNVSFFENSCLMPFELIKEFYANLDEDDFDMEIKGQEMLWKRNQTNFDGLINMLRNIKPVSSQPLVRLHLKRQLIELMLMSYVNSKENFEGSDIQRRETLSTLQSARSLVDTNKDYFTTCEHYEIVRERKRFLKIFPYTKKSTVKVIKTNLDVEKFAKYHENKKLEEEMNQKIEEIDINNKIYSSTIESIKAPILYIEHMIKRTAMSGSYHNIHAMDILSDLIGKLKDAGETNSKDLEQYESTLKELVAMHKVFNEINVNIEPDVLKKIIHYCEVCVRYEDFPQTDKSKAQAVLKDMKKKFNPQTLDELKNMAKSFESSLDSYFDAFFVPRMC
jgi:hypothetical protein